MGDLVSDSHEYLNLLQNIKKRITSARIIASRHVNRELILLYWDIGSFIIEKQKQEEWGKSVVEQLSKDIQKEFSAITGFSPQNLWFMRQFYSEYTDSDFLQQVVRELKNIPEHLIGKQAEFLLQSIREIDCNEKNINMLQSVTELKDNKNYTEGKLVLNLLQLVRDFDYEQQMSLIRALVSLIPWGQNILIFTKIKNAKERLYYILATATYGWSRAVLLNQIKAKAYERSLIEEKVNNFDVTMPEYLAEHEKLEVEFSLMSKNNPIGVAEYQLFKTLPEELKGKLPSVKEIAKITENMIKGTTGS